MRISALDIQRPERLDDLKKKLDNLEECMRGGETTCNAVAGQNTLTTLKDSGSNPE